MITHFAPLIALFMLPMKAMTLHYGRADFCGVFSTSLLTSLWVMYLGQPYERDANDFAYEKVKALLGDSPELQELHAFWTPKKAIEDQAYEELYLQIDKMIGEANESEDTSPTDGYNAPSRIL